MGSRLVPRATVLVGAFVALLAVGLGAAAAAAAPVVVGSVKCLDCSPMDVNAEDALKGLKVAVKCKSGADETYETKALAPLDDTGAFSIPLAAELLRDDGELDRDCFTQLHSSPDTPCVGQAPPRIAPAELGQDSNVTTYLAAAADAVFGPVACACGKFKKKHFMFGPPPPPPRPEAPKPPTPTPTYGPPMPTPAPEPKPPAPPVEEPEPEPFFHKHPKMKKFMHKKKPCPPLVDDDTTRPAAGGNEKLPKKLN